MINLYDSASFTHVSKRKNVFESLERWHIYSFGARTWKCRLMINALYLIVTVGAVKTACIHIILLQLALIVCKCQYLCLSLFMNDWMKKDLWPRIFIINFSYFLGDRFFYEIVSSLFTFWMLSDLVLLRYKLSELFLSPSSSKSNVELLGRLERYPHIVWFGLNRSICGSKAFIPSLAWERFIFVVTIVNLFRSKN